MKITKYNHSCLIVEEDHKVIVIDPGNYSTPIFPINGLQQLDYILITHEHQDHFDLPLVKQLVAKFPQVKIIATQPVVETLQKEGITATTQGNADILVTPIPHEKVWMGPSADNNMVTVLGKLSHPGDSLHISQTAEILALPISGPWCNTTEAVQLATTLKPKVIIPIHDWHWKDEVRAGMHQRLKEYFASLGIDFRPIATGEAINNL